jgi:DNA-directed RNA polymerase specialized sigma24 family protein
MSKMAELAYDIEQLYIDGLSVREIAEELECPLGIVTEWIKSQGVDA